MRICFFIDSEYKKGLANKTDNRKISTLNKITDKCTSYSNLSISRNVQETLVESLGLMCI